MVFLGWCSLDGKPARGLEMGRVKMLELSDAERTPGGVGTVRRTWGFWGG